MSMSERIDRAFFRSAYDARRILEELSEKTRTTTGRRQLTDLLQTEINQALRPLSVVVYLESSNAHRNQAFRAALENIRSAELMAEHIEAERRAAEERVEAERRLGPIQSKRRSPFSVKNSVEVAVH